MRSVHIKYVKNLLKIGVAQGYELPLLLELSGFNFDPMSATDTHQSVSAKQYSALSHQIGNLLQDECFGFYNGFSVPCGTFRMMCYAVIPCKTLYAATLRMRDFAVMCANIRGAQGDTSELISIDSASELASYTDPQLRVATISENFRTQIAIAATLTSWHRFCSWLIATPIELAEVTFEGPCDFSGAESFFDCQLTFNQPSNSLKFHRRFLEMPLRQSESSLVEFLKLAPYQLGPQRESDPCEEDLEDRVREAIGYNFNNLLPSFDEVAELVSMSSRTLRRQLEQRGKTYREIKDEQRKKAALVLVARHELELNAVAALMGFDEPSAFHRAFKRWVGMPPGKYREMLQGENASNY